MRNNYLKRTLEHRASDYKEDVAREVKTHGHVRPVEHQVGTKTWKSYSRIRRPSDAYRDGYSHIDWGKTSGS